jgi:hypothetical protein
MSMVLATSRTRCVCRKPRIALDPVRTPILTWPLACTIQEFALALFKDEEPTAQQRANIPQRPTLACYKDNEWLKGSNGIFDGIGGSTGEG